MIKQIIQIYKEETCLIIKVHVGYLGTRWFTMYKIISFNLDFTYNVDNDKSNLNSYKTSDVDIKLINAISVYRY